jgi:hypothetical protein
VPERAAFSETAQRDRLGAVAKWTIVDGPREYQPSGGEDAARGWAWELERGGERSTVRVELSGTAGVVISTGHTIAEEADHAVRTRGKSAVELWLDEDQLPERIVIHTEGVSRPSGQD